MGMRIGFIFNFDFFYLFIVFAGSKPLKGKGGGGRSREAEKKERLDKRKGRITKMKRRTKNIIKTQGFFFITQ
jgi:hypothetical protein